MKDNLNEISVEIGVLKLDELRHMENKFQLNAVERTKRIQAFSTRVNCCHGIVVLAYFSHIRYYSRTTSDCAKNTRREFHSNRRISFVIQTV